MQHPVYLESISADSCGAEVVINLKRASFWHSAHASFQAMWLYGSKDSCFYGLYLDHAAW